MKQRRKLKRRRKKTDFVITFTKRFDKLANEPNPIQCIQQVNTVFTTSMNRAYDKYAPSLQQVCTVLATGMHRAYGNAMPYLQ